jgi:hypothetical protein
LTVVPADGFRFTESARPPVDRAAEGPSGPTPEKIATLAGGIVQLRAATELRDSMEGFAELPTNDHAEAVVAFGNLAVRFTAKPTVAFVLTSIRFPLAR